MINSERIEKQRSGLQGSLGFVKTNPNLDTALYEKILRYIKSSEQLGNSGGIPANINKTAQGYEESHVFSSQSSMQRVKQRIEKSLTDFLGQEVGPQAQAANQSIPAFLQAKGIRGIRETGRGDNKRLTAYRPDNFIESSQNPIVGSTDKEIKAYMTQIGAKYSTGGGTREGRRVHAYLRPNEAEYVNKKVDDTVIRANAGTINMGDMEALYASMPDTIEAKRNRKAYKSKVADVTDNFKIPAVKEEFDDKILRQEKYKIAYKKRKQELVASGDLEDDSKPKDDKDKTKESPAKKAAKGAGVLLLGVVTSLNAIKNLVMSMVSILTRISTDMGSLIKDSADLGMDTNEAKRYQNWAIANPTYSGGNNNILLDMMKGFNDKFGDITKFDKNGNFTSAAFNKYSETIGLTVDASIAKDPIGGTKKIVGAFAEKYANSSDKKSELKTQMIVLKETFDASFAEGYKALILAASAQGLKIDKNLMRNSIDPDRVNKLATAGGTRLDALGVITDSFNIEGNTKNLNDVLGDLGKIQNALLMILLSNMDLIIQILLGIAKGVLWLAKVANIPGGEEGYNKLVSTEGKMATAGFKNTMVNAEKFKASANDEITAYLREKKVPEEQIAGERDKIFGAISNGEDIPAEHADIVKGQRGVNILAGVVNYRESQNALKDLYAGRFTTFSSSGDVSNTIQHNSGALLASQARYGNTYSLLYPWRDSVENKKISKEAMSRVNDVTSGKTKNIVQPNLSFYEEVDEVLNKINPLTPEGPLYKPTEELPVDPYVEKINKGRAEDLINKSMNLMPKGYKFNKKPETKAPDFSILPLSSLGGPLLSSNSGGSGAAAGSGVDEGVVTIVNQIDLTMNGKVISSNVQTLAAEQQKRSFNSVQLNLGGVG